MYSLTQREYKFSRLIHLNCSHIKFHSTRILQPICFCLRVSFFAEVVYCSNKISYWNFTFLQTEQIRIYVQASKRNENHHLTIEVKQRWGCYRFSTHRLHLNEWLEGTIENFTSFCGCCENLMYAQKHYEKW